MRKVILSTSLAETSLTIEGVRVVIDSGFSRMPCFDPRRGMSGLVTVPVSRSSADQRRGRAGRTQPGVCYRLWTEPEQAALPAHSPPEILAADLAPLALELARWGTPLGEGLRFLDPPPAAHLAQAAGLLRDLGAVDGSGKLTPHGRAMSELPVHPRFAHMLLRGKDLGLGALACDLAALLDERDLLRRSEPDAEIDLHSRWQALRGGHTRERFARERARSQASRLKRILKVDDTPVKEEHLGLLLACAYPERVAKRRAPGTDRYQLSGGVGAVLPRGSMLWRHEYLAVGEVDGVAREVKIFLAEPIGESDIREAFASQLRAEDEVHWDERSEAVVARQVMRLGSVELSETPLSPASEILLNAMLDGIRRMGPESLPWSRSSLEMRLRSEWLRKQGMAGKDWPDLSDEHLLSTLGEWLGPYLGGVTKRSHLKKLDMGAIVEGLFTHQQLRALDKLAPTHIVVPTGSRIPVDYGSGPIPVLAVRLQEMFSQTQTPTVAGGRVPVLLHLLSPARRPLAVTQDLVSFWKNAYPEVRKDMRGRYPKHHWPEDPLKAPPTRRTKRHGAG